MVKVLVVDDDQESRELVAEVLTSNGYEVGVVEDTMAAQRALDDSEYQIVIADLQMPNENGLELLQHLRRQKTKHELILMSSFISAAERKTALGLGVGALLEKPFRLSELLQAVAELASKSSIGISS
ncbi:MAG: response regulator [Terriglobia bacterium]